MPRGKLSSDTAKDAPRRYAQNAPKDGQTDGGSNFHIVSSVPHQLGVDGANRIRKQAAGCIACGLDFAYNEYFCTKMNTYLQKIFMPMIDNVKDF